MTTYSNLITVVPENIPAMRHKASVFSWPVKAAQFDINAVKGEVEGYLTLWDDPMLQQPYEDSYKDVVCPGAFLKTIGELDQKRKFRGDDWLHPHLWQHDGKELIGGCCHLQEDDTGVFFAVKMCMGVRRAQEAVALMVDGLGLGISYGYDPIKSQPMNNRRYLKEIRLHESSSVTFPAHEWASVTNVKADGAEGSDMALTATQLKNRHIYDMAARAATIALLNADKDTYASGVITDLVADHSIPPDEKVIEEIKSVCGDTSLPIGPRDESWDSSKAHGQIVTWATKADDSLDTAKLKSVHLRVDGDATKIGSYSYPFCYIIDGSPRISVGGVIACAGALSGSRGAKSNPDSDGMKKKVATLYSKINSKFPDASELTPPWNKSDETPGGSAIKARDFTTIWTQRQTDELMNELYHMEDTLQFAIMENMCDDSVLDKDTALAAVVSQFSSQLQLWATMYVAADAAEDAMEDAGGGDDGDDDSVGYPMSMGMMAANRADRAIKMATGYLMQLKEGKVLSGENHATIKKVVGGLQDHAKTLQQLLDTASAGADPEMASSSANNGSNPMMDASAMNSSTMPTPKSGVPDFLDMVSKMLTQKATTLSPLASDNAVVSGEPGKPGQEPDTNGANDTVTALFADMSAFVEKISAHTP